VAFRQGLFNLTSDSGLFRTREALEAVSAVLKGNVFLHAERRYLPLYQAKMMYLYDHRFGDYNLLAAGQSAHMLPGVPVDRLQDSDYVPLPRYWVSESDVEARLAALWGGRWLLGWRDVTDARASARTVVATLLPRVGFGNTIFLMFPAGVHASLASILGANLSSFALDFIARQRVGGIHLNYPIIKQLAVLPPATYRVHTPWSPATSLHDWLLARVLELVFTSWDMQPFARDMGYDGPPFPWDEERRFLLRCELDAAFFHLYGIERDDVDYIMATFPIVKKKDEAKHREYRTQRVILEMYDVMRRAIDGGAPCRGATDEQLKATVPTGGS
jgi:hypothetical protein